MTGTGRIEVAVRDGAAWVTLSNPSRRNALTRRMLAQLGAALGDLDADASVRAIVVRGHGEVAFASGADLSEFEAEQSSDQTREAADQAVAGLFGALSDLHTPLIAMIHGYCLGAGLALALGADLRLASEGSTFAIPAARLGIGYPVHLTHVLVEAVGPAHASEILFTGRTVNHVEAQATGLVNRVVPAASLLDETTAIAERIIENAPLSIRAAKAAIRSHGSPDLTSRAERLVAACVGSDDAREGQRAFAEKRSPVFGGR